MHATGPQPTFSMRTFRRQNVMKLKLKVDKLSNNPTQNKISHKHTSQQMSCQGRTQRSIIKHKSP